MARPLGQPHGVPPDERLGETHGVRRRHLRSVASLPLLTVVCVVAAGACSAGDDSRKPAAAATTSAASGATNTGTITGVVKLSGGPADGANSLRPVAGGVVTFVGHGRTTAAMSEQGRFTAELRPGIYVVSATTPDYNFGGAACEAVHPVRVTAGKVASVEVFCQVR
jgi:hypothetical protein